MRLNGKSLLLVGLLLFVALSAAAQTSYDPDLAAQIEKANDLMRDRRYDDAVVEFKRADEMAQGKSYDAAIGLAQNCRNTQDYVAAEATALRAVDLAPNKIARAHAYWTAAMAAMGQAERVPAKCTDAEKEFRAALDLRPDDNQFTTRYFLGRVLLRAGRDQDGIAELKRFLAVAAENASVNKRLVEIAQQLIADPGRGHESSWRLLSASQPAPKPAAVNFSNVQDPAVRDRLLKGQQLLNTKKYDDAIKEFKAASKAAKEKCFECFIALAVGYQSVDADKNALESTQHALALATTGDQRAAAHGYAGLSYMGMGQNKADKYKDAEREFRTVVELAPTSEFAHLNLGMSLLKQSRDNEGIAELKTFLSQHADSARVQETEKIIADPRRAREFFMPEFSITTIDGQYIDSTELVGKIVVLDFWASWCGPCRSALGDLRSLSKRFADKPVVVISLSSDTDEATWRTFVQKNNMTWPQYFDEQRKVARLFGVHAYPSYFVVDAEGIVKGHVVGADKFDFAGVEDEVKKGLKKIEAQKKSATASPGN